MSRIVGSIIASLALVGLAAARVFSVSLPPGLGQDRTLLGLTLVALTLQLAVVIRAARQHRAAQSLTLDLENANIKLSQLDKLKSEFLSFASHQIKAPMSVIKGYTQLIADGSYGPVSAKVTDVVGKIRASSERMIGLVDTFLDLRKLDEGRVEYHMETVDLGMLAASLVDEMRRLADAKELKLTLTAPDRAWKVSADAQYLRHVLQNLVDNAIKYTDRGTVTVSLAAGDTPGTVQVRVTDTGRGISRELAPKLFEQFSRDPSVSREIAGTGLGLYLARRTIEAHRGRIWATSAGPGHGSTFVIELPVL